MNQLKLGEPMSKCQNLNGKNIFVTGADGFIGSHLVERLVRLGGSVKALCYYNSQGSLGWLENVDADVLNNLEIAFGDIRDSALVQQQLVGADYIFHLASLISIPHSYVASQSYLDSNLGGLLNILEALKKQSFSRMINTSTSEVYGSAMTRPIIETHPLQAQSPYSASKIAADHFVQAFYKSFELPLCILRPFNTYGPRQSMRAVIPTVIAQLLDADRQNLELGDLTPLRDFNYIDDTVDAFIQLMFCENVAYGEPYNAGSGHSISIADTVALIEKVVGIKKPIIVDNNKKRPKNSEVIELIADYTKLNKACGWEPKVAMDKGLGYTVEWFKNHDNQKDSWSRRVKFD